MSLTRRVFLKNGAMALVGTAAVPSFLARAVHAQTLPVSRRRLVVIFQRGAADGLNIVVPHGERAYYEMRPTIAVQQSQVIDLDGFFGLHPSLEAFKPIWDQRHLAIVHAAGSPDNTRSHFDAQDYMESGTPGLKSTDDGWLNRAVRLNPKPAALPFRTVGMNGALPRILSGTAPALAIGNLSTFGVSARPQADAFETMYDESVDSLLRGTGREVFDAVKMLKAANPQKYTPAAGAEYPRGAFGDSMRQLAQLMKADLGVQVAFADISGWDHHVEESPQLANRLREFAQGIAAFWTDLGNLGEETVIVTMSEFGRTARENGNRGTDHGHANCMFLIGGPVRGGHVYGRWPGLDASQLYEARDLALTTDFRTVMAEAVARQIGTTDLQKVFPGFETTSAKFLKLLG